MNLSVIFAIVLLFGYVFVLFADQSVELNEVETQPEVENTILTSLLALTPNPTRFPTTKPTKNPSPSPSARPTKTPTMTPTRKPTSEPTAKPTKSPSPAPSAKPTRSPTEKPTVRPTLAPTTRNPTASPSFRPTRNPTAKPTKSPSPMPSARPTKAPTMKPTKNPTFGPTIRPSRSPTNKPTKRPSFGPTVRPTRNPTPRPTKRGPTASPTISLSPTYIQTSRPTHSPTESPSAFPTVASTDIPTETPTASPTEVPTTTPTKKPTTSVPSVAPTFEPTNSPSEIPTTEPTTSPTEVPTGEPTTNPTEVPTSEPTANPTEVPTNEPTTVPTSVPTTAPSQTPTMEPSEVPSMIPTVAPSTKEVFTGPTLSFKILLTVSNFSKATFSNEEIIVLINDLSTFSGLSNEYFSYNPVSTNGRFLRVFAVPNGLTSQYFLIFNVQVPLTGQYADYVANPNALYNNITSSLSSAQTNNRLTIWLRERENTVLAGAPDLQYAEIVSLQFSDSTSVQSQGSHSNKALSIWAVLFSYAWYYYLVAGVIILALIITASFLAIQYLYPMARMRYRSKKFPELQQLQTMVELKDAGTPRSSLSSLESGNSQKIDATEEDPNNLRYSVIYGSDNDQLPTYFSQTEIEIV